MADTFEQDQVEFAPPWLQRPVGAAWFSAFGAEKDALKAMAIRAVEARFPVGSSMRTNLLRNSSFERGALDSPNGFVPAGWGEYNNLADVRDYSIRSRGGVDGGRCVRCAWSTASTDRIGWYTSSGMTVSGLPAGVVGEWRQGQWYAVSFYARGTGDVLGKAMGLAWNTEPDESVQIQAPGLTGDWQRFAFKIRWTTTSPEGAGRLYVAFAPATTSGSIDLDAVQVEEGELATEYILTTDAPATIAIDGAPSDALPPLAEEVGLSMGVTEPESNFRQRLARAWDSWLWAGSPYGLLRAMQLAGFPSVKLQCQSGIQWTLGNGGTPADLMNLPITGALGGSPQRWSDIAILIPKPWPTWWGSTAPADGSADQRTAAFLVSRWKGAHNRCVSMKVIDGLTWDSGIHWDDGSRWDTGGITTWTPPAS